MYSIIVSAFDEDATDHVVVLTKDRFLENTAPEFSPQLRELSVEAQACLTAWPCLLMREGRAEEIAYIARIVAIGVSARDVKVTVRHVAQAVPLRNFSIWKLRDALDIGQYEFNRNHWAVKDRDLLSVLRQSGVMFDASIDALFLDAPLPAPSRTALLKAKDIIGQWGHTQIDNFLLEAGVEHLVAGPELGSRQNRANAILTFSLANPGSITAERSLFSAFIVNKALSREEIQQQSAVPKFVESAQRAQANREEPVSAPASNRVFVVHGQNAEAKSAVVSFLSSLGLVAIVLHEQPNMGRHLLTKFIDEAELATFAVVLLTDDDEGGLKGGPHAARARQNVILELGYFLSHLGQAKVCALKTPGVETPSDFDGIVYIAMDAEENWQRELRRELVAARMPIQGA